MLEKMLLTGSPKWNKTCVNISFLRSLFSRYGAKIFTNKDAYAVYYKKHLVEDAKYPNGKLIHRRGENPRVVHTGSVSSRYAHIISYLVEEEFTSRVRSILCASACLGAYGLIKIKNGTYKFKKEGIPKTYCIRKHRKGASFYYIYHFKRY